VYPSLAPFPAMPDLALEATVRLEYLKKGKEILGISLIY